MTQKTYPAFDYIIIKNDIAAGEILNDDVFTDGVYTAGDNFSFAWVYTKGAARITEVNTGETRIKPTGYNNIAQPEPVGTWRTEIIEPMIAFCVPPQGSLVPKLKFFSLAGGETTTLPVGCKLYVCSGSLTCAGRTVPAYRQLHIKTAATSVTANTQVYGIIFP
jgi:hypothetical protein